MLGDRKHWRHGNMLRVLRAGLVMALSTTSVVLANLPGRQERPTNLPQELEALGAKLGCEPVPGFYDRPGMIEPPYLYGYIPGRKENSAVFWCFRRKDEMYLFVAMRNGRIHSHFEWPYGFPDGLSLDTVERRLLSSFVYVDNPRMRGPEGRYTEYKPVVSYYDGMTHILYEHEGRWLVRQYH
jgi:hypothetical protein